MLANVAALQPRERREVHVEAEALDLVLLRFLEELVYRKDAEQVLLRPTSMRVTQREDRWVVDAVLAGEGIDPTRHQLSADVKAVTLHRLSVQRHDGQWDATVVLDI
jgi:SHS2 domain-containing protein